MVAACLEKSDLKLRDLARGAFEGVIVVVESQNDQVLVIEIDGQLNSDLVARQ